MLTIDQEFNPTAADTAIAAARAAYDRDPASLDAVALAAFGCWATPEQGVRANGQPATAKPVQAVAPAAPAPVRRAKPPTVFSSFGASPPKAPAMTDAEARKLLLAQIADRRGGAAARRCRHMTVDQLAAALGSMKATPSRQVEISESWSRTFTKRGVETNAETKPGSWDRAFARLGVAIK
jgi:hypothetical protein